MVRGNMDRISIGLVCALLLLIQYGNGADLSITSPNPSPTTLMGNTINLTISYSSTASMIVWTVNSSIVALKMNGLISVAATYENRVTLEDNYLTISGATLADSGEYKVMVTDTSNNSGVFVFNVVVRGPVQEIQSNDTGIYETGENITLTVRYEGRPTAISWYYNGSPLVIKVDAYGYEYISDRFRGRLIVSENGSLVIYNTTNQDAGNYTINVITSFVPGSRSFQVTFYDPVENVKVTQSPDIVSENSTSVNLICNATSGFIESVTWLKDGKSITSDLNYNLLDGNQILQIIKPNRTFSGTYTCNISNTVYWSSRFLELLVYDPVEGVTVTQSPQIVNETSPDVSLICSASRVVIESVTWKKDGKSITDDLNYKLINNNQTLKIMIPNGKFSGNYTCNISNAAYWNSSSFELRVYDPVENVTVEQSPQIASEKSSKVNLTCNASSSYIESTTWMKDGQSISNDRNYTLLDGGQILQIIEPNRTYSGNYSCNISNAAYWSFGSLQLRVYDPVENVIVTQSPEKVNKTSPLVKLTCSSSSGYIEEVSWTKDEKPVFNKDSYNLLDGNRVLQITKPNKTFNGIYTCKMSNAVYFSSAFVNLTVSYAPVSATSTFSMLITSLLGGILLAH